MHFPKSCLINEGRTRPARRCRAREARAVCGAARGGEKEVVGEGFIFSLFLKRMTPTKFSPLDPLFRCTPPAHPASGLRTLSPPLAPAPRRWRRPPPPRSRRAPAPGDDGRAGGEGPAPGTFAGSGGGGSAGKPRAAGASASAAGGEGGGEEGGGRGRGRGRGWGGPGLLLHSPLEPTGFLYVRHSVHSKKEERKSPPRSRPAAPSAAPLPRLKEPRPGRERRAPPGTHGAQGPGPGGRARDGPLPRAGPGRWVARAAQASRAAAARWVCEGPPRACGRPGARAGASEGPGAPGDPHAAGRRLLTGCAEKTRWKRESLCPFLTGCRGVGGCTHRVTGARPPGEDPGRC